MLDASALNAVSYDQMKSFIMRQLLADIYKYNAMPAGSSVQQKADQLLAVCKTAAKYCTAKPPLFKLDKPLGGKTYRRWAAVDALLGQIGDEVERLNLRMLMTPKAGFREIGKTGKRSYWLELVDPLHGAGHDLSTKYAEWLTDANSISARKSFWDYIGRPPLALDDDDYIVKYYPDMDEDDKGLLHFKNGCLCDEDGPWSTAKLETHFGGRGWGIFVVSPDGRIFGGSHVVGQHHHSSFLGGGMVTAAGEMVVDERGVVRFITAKSGHYVPTEANMKLFATQFYDIPADTLIQPNFRQPVVHRIGEFRLSTPDRPAPGLCREEIEVWMREKCGQARFQDLDKVASDPKWKSPAYNAGLFYAYAKKGPTYN